MCQNPFPSPTHSRYLGLVIKSAGFWRRILNEFFFSRKTGLNQLFFSRKRGLNRPGFGEEEKAKHTFVSEKNKIEKDKEGANTLEFQIK
jgi:hypothetical protein